MAIRMVIATIPPPATHLKATNRIGVRDHARAATADPVRGARAAAWSPASIPASRTARLSGRNPLAHLRRAASSDSLFPSCETGEFPFTDSPFHQNDRLFVNGECVLLLSDSHVVRTCISRRHTVTVTHVRPKRGLPLFWNGRTESGTAQRTNCLRSVTKPYFVYKHGACQADQPPPARRHAQPVRPCCKAG